MYLRVCLFKFPNVFLPFHRRTNRKEEPHPARGRHRGGETGRDSPRNREIQGNHEG